MLYVTVAGITAVFGLVAAEMILWPLRRRNAKLERQVAARRRRIRELERDLALLDNLETKDLKPEITE